MLIQKYKIMSQESIALDRDLLLNLGTLIYISRKAEAISLKFCSRIEGRDNKQKSK